MVENEKLPRTNTKYIFWFKQKLHTELKYSQYGGACRVEHCGVQTHVQQLSVCQHVFMNAETLKGINRFLVITQCNTTVLVAPFKMKGKKKKVFFFFAFPTLSKSPKHIMGTDTSKPKCSTLYIIASNLPYIT